MFARAVYERHAGFDQTPPILSDADAILRWMIDADAVFYPDPLALRRRWPGSVTAKTQHSAAMSDTMKFLVKNVMHHAIASNALSAPELSKLEAALAGTFFDGVNPIPGPGAAVMPAARLHQGVRAGLTAQCALRFSD